MPAVRATTMDITWRVDGSLHEEAAQAAGSNNIVSRAEQDQISDPLLKETAEEIRAAGGSGARVYADELGRRATEKVLGLLASVNTTGPHQVSQAEVRALH